MQPPLESIAPSRCAQPSVVTIVPGGGVTEHWPDAALENNIVVPTSAVAIAQDKFVSSLMDLP